MPFYRVSVSATESWATAGQNIKAIFPFLSEEIDIPDVEPVAFMVLLKYLYCDEIDLEADTVLAVLYAAKKYIVPHLARSCVRFLETSLSAKNACVLLSQSRLFEVSESDGPSSICLSPHAGVEPSLISTGTRTNAAVLGSD